MPIAPKPGEGTWMFWKGSVLTMFSDSCYCTTYEGNERRLRFLLYTFGIRYYFRNIHRKYDCPGPITRERLIILKE